MDSEYPITFERMAHGAYAIGHTADGKVVMAAGVAPGDAARVRTIKDHRGWLEAEIVTVDARGPNWVQPECRHARSGECGGCAWQHLSEAAQHAEKFALVKREVGRVAPEAEVRPIRTDVPPFGYRRRAKLGHKEGMLGYRMRGQRRIFDVWQCPVLVPDLEVALDEIREATSGWKPGNVDIMVNSEGEVVVGGPARSFLQPSQATERVLIELVLEAVPEKAKRVEELFCGSGTLSIPLLERGHTLRGWELDRPSLVRLQERWPGVATVRADLMHADPDIDLGHPDAIVLDPPRRGAKSCIPAIARARAPVLCYVSCEPMTLCRDIGQLHRFGYRVDWITPVDAFPQTEHIECVARLRLHS